MTNVSVSFGKPGRGSGFLYIFISPPCGWLPRIMPYTAWQSGQTGFTANHWSRQSEQNAWPHLSRVLGCVGVSRQTLQRAGRLSACLWGRSVTCCQLFGRFVTCFHSFHHALESDLDGGDLGVVDVDEVNVCETGGAASTQIVKLLYCRQVTLCTDLLGHSEYSC